jgi:hypothetical protein
VWSFVYVYDCVLWVCFVFVRVCLDYYCRCIGYGYVGDSGVVYVVFYVGCDVCFVYCSVVLDWEAVWVYWVVELVFCEGDDVWGVGEEFEVF